MKKFDAYDNAKVMAGPQPRLPIGGYVVEILHVEESVNDWGSALIVSFDIIEGEHKGFYSENFNAQMEPQKWKGNLRLGIPKDDGSEKDGWTANAFKTAVDAIEKSNPGYAWDWDESKLKGKIVGALFRNKEYEYQDYTGFFTECCKFIPAEDVRAGKYKVPRDKLLPGSTKTSGFAPLSEDDVDLPF